MYDDLLYISNETKNTSKYCKFPSSFYFILYLQNAKISGSKKVPVYVTKYITPHINNSLTKSQVEYIKNIDTKN